MSRLRPGAAGPSTFTPRLPPLSPVPRMAGLRNNTVLQWSVGIRDTPPCSEPHVCRVCTSLAWGLVMGICGQSHLRSDPHGPFPGGWYPPYEMTELVRDQFWWWSTCLGSLETPSSSGQTGQRLFCMPCWAEASKASGTSLSTETSLHPGGGTEGLFSYSWFEWLPEERHK